MNIEPVRPQGGRSRALAGALVGLLMILVGATWLAGNLGFEEAHEVLSQFWPLLLVVFGISVLVTRQNGVLGVALILGGLYAFARERNLLEVDFWAVFGPTMIVLIGASVIWRAFYRPGPEGPTDSYIRAFSVWSGTELRPTHQFEGAELTAVMGGAKLDLSRAPIARDSVTIDVFLLMGGAEITVPPDWEVTQKVTLFMGGCVDRRRPTTQPPTRRLLIRGFAMMGAVEIKD
jgi:hypothetical protein